MSGEGAALTGGGTGGGCISLLGGLEIGIGDAATFTAVQVTGVAQPH